jgi:glycosyltransferase involved in cell wall biosynthesis
MFKNNTYKHMKIAMLSPIAWRTPPRNYGPWEQVASVLTEALVKKGLDVTLFATGDSVTTGKLQSVCATPYAEDINVDAKVWECLHISHLMEQADDFDIVHNHFDFLPLTYSRLIKTPMVTTIHGFSSEKIIPVYKKYNATSTYISISDSDRHPELNYHGTIYHGIDPTKFEFQEHKEDYLLFYGRIHPEKGTTEAIEIAKRCGYPIKIAGLIQNQYYYSRDIAPKLDDKNVMYLGNVSQVEGNRLLGGARALLHPITFDEPFGLSVAESMMCGTPVIAFNRGSMPELIQDGKSGYLVKTIDQAVAAVKKLVEISPQDCRTHAIEKIGIDTMSDAYVQVYKKIIG